MKPAAHARELIAYNEWANGKILAAAATLRGEQLSLPLAASFDCIGGNLEHIVGAQVIWLARWRGSRPSWPQLRTYDELRAAFDASHVDLRSFVADLTAADWDRVIEYRDSRGQERARPLGQLISHLVNHGTHHRAETGIALATLGHSPGDPDLLYFMYEQG